MIFIIHYHCVSVFFKFYSFSILSMCKAECTLHDVESVDITNVFQDHMKLLEFLVSSEYLPPYSDTALHAVTITIILIISR